MNFIKQVYMAVRSQYWFTAAKGLFIGSLGTQIVSAYQGGHLDFTLTGFEHMMLAAAVATIISLEGLKTPPPK
jgi:hypothetical protein